MPSLRNRRFEIAPFKTLTWKTPRLTWGDLPQIADGYRQPALGYSVGRELWLDPYAVRKDHVMWWDTYLGHHYQMEADADHVVAFLVHPSETFEVIRPETPDISDGDLPHVEAIARALDVPDEAELRWSVDTDALRYQRLPVGEFYTDA